MNLALVITGLIIAAFFTSATVWAISYEEVESIPGGYTVYTVRSEFQALLAAIAAVGAGLMLIGLAMEGSTKKPQRTAPYAAQLPPSGTKAFCPSCGQRIMSMSFCPYCGVRL